MKKLVVSTLVTLFFFGYASMVYSEKDLFGFCVTKPEKFSQAITEVYKDEEGIKYRYVPELCDTDIQCWGKFERYGTVDLTIKNGSKNHIEMNYISDEYVIMTTDGSTHKLEIVFTRSSFAFKRYHEPLNPGNEKTIRVSGFNGKIDDIQYFFALLNFGKTFIVLKKIDKKQD